MSPFIPSKYSGTGSCFGDLGDVSSVGHSQNGWPASIDPSQIDVISIAVPLSSGKSKTIQVARKAAPVLVTFAQWWDKNIEPITELYCYNYREIRGYEGSGTISNHGSGTALDINASKHPLAAEGTVTPAQHAAISAKALELGLRYGGDYNGRKDEMHVEVNSTVDQMVDIGKSLVKNHWILGTAIFGIGALGIVGAVYYRKVHHEPIKLRHRQVDIVE